MCIFCDNMISNNNLHKKGSQITIYKSCKQESRTPNCKIWSRLSTSLFYCWLVVWTSRNRNNAPKIIILGSHAFSESAPFPLLRLSLDIRLNRVQNYAFGSITTGLCTIQCQHLMDNGQYKSSLLIIDWFSWWHILVSLGFSFSPPWPPVSRDPRRWLGCISGIWKGLNRSHLGLLVVATASSLVSRSLTIFWSHSYYDQCDTSNVSFLLITYGFATFCVLVLHVFFLGQRHRPPDFQLMFQYVWIGLKVMTLFLLKEVLCDSVNRLQSPSHFLQEFPRQQAPPGSRPADCRCHPRLIFSQFFNRLWSSKRIWWSSLSWSKSFKWTLIIQSKRR